MDGMAGITSTEQVSEMDTGVAEGLAMRVILMTVISLLNRGDSLMLVCYKKSDTGKFTGLQEMENDMPGDLIRFGWYSYVWNGKNGFKEIITSD